MAVGMQICGVEVPAEFICSITRDIMRDPVTAMDGHVYERSAINQWLQNSNRSPLTNEVLPSQMTVPCHPLRALISGFLEQHSAVAQYFLEEHSAVAKHEHDDSKDMLLFPSTATRSHQPLVHESSLSPFQDSAGERGATEESGMGQGDIDDRVLAARSALRRSVSLGRRGNDQAVAERRTLLRGSSFGKNSFRNLLEAPSQPQKMDSVLMEEELLHPVAPEPQSQERLLMGGDGEVSEMTTGVSAAMVEESAGSSESIALKLSAEWTEIAADTEEEVYALVSISATRPALCGDDGAGRGFEGGGVDVVAVVDCSGSMHGRKSCLLLRALIFLSERLRSCDRLSVVAFNHRAKCVTGLQRMNATGKRALADAARYNWSLTAAGGTDIVAGVRVGCEVLRRRRTSNTLASMLVFTDGQDDDAYELCGGLTHGPSSAPPPAWLVDRPEVGGAGAGAGHGGSRRGGCATLRELMPAYCSFHCFGLGEDCDSKLLAALAESISGATFTFIEDETHIPASFGCCLGGLLSIVAHRICLRMRAPPHRPSLVPSDGQAPIRVELMACESHNAQWKDTRWADDDEDKRAAPVCPAHASLDAGVGRPGLRGGSRDERGGGCVMEVEIGDMYAEEERSVLVVLRIGPVAPPGVGAAVRDGDRQSHGCGGRSRGGGRESDLGATEDKVPVLEACVDYVDVSRSADGGAGREEGGVRVARDGDSEDGTVPRTRRRLGVKTLCVALAADAEADMVGTGQGARGARRGSGGDACGAYGQAGRRKRNLDVDVQLNRLRTWRALAAAAEEEHAPLEAAQGLEAAAGRIRASASSAVPLSQQFARELDEAARRFRSQVRRTGPAGAHVSVGGSRREEGQGGSEGGEEGAGDESCPGHRDESAANGALVRSQSLMHRLQRASSWRETAYTTGSQRHLIAESERQTGQPAPD